MGLADGRRPGDPGLLTLHALNGLRQADVIVHDALVDDRTLTLAGPDCEIIYAGKRGGKPSPRQLDISARLVKLRARRQTRVCGSKAAIRLFSGVAAKKRWRWLPPVSRSALSRASPPVSAGSPMPVFR